MLNQPIANAEQKTDRKNRHQHNPTRTLKSTTHVDHMLICVYIYIYKMHRMKHEAQPSPRYKIAIPSDESALDTIAQCHVKIKSLSPTCWYQPNYTQTVGEPMSAGRSRSSLFFFLRLGSKHIPDDLLSGGMRETCK